MNYYQHHIGDFEAATSHLTLVEDAIYSRLIRLYYRREAPIPADVRAAARLIRALDQLEVVGDILAEFFTLSDDGWHQDRCDEEVAEYQARAERAQRNGAKGGRPKRQPTDEGGDGSPTGGNDDPGSNSPPTTIPDETGEKPTGLSDQTQTKAHHSPLTTHHSPFPSNQEPRTNTGDSTPPQSLPAATASATTGKAPPGPPPDPSELDIGKGKRRTRRCPQSFVVDDAMRAWAAAECPLVDVHQATAAMRDHEFRDPKTDWLATWRNWLRNEQRDAARRPQARASPGRGHVNAQIALEESNRAIAAAWRPPEFTTTKPH